MPCLDDPKREKFAVQIVAGKTQVEAYKSAGFRTKHPRQAASTMANRPEVAARIRELTSRIGNSVTQRLSENVATTKEWVLTKLRENAEEALSVKGGSAVANRALELLGKELGLFKEPEVKLPTKLEDLPPDTLANMLAEAEAKAVSEAAAMPPATPVTQ